MKNLWKGFTVIALLCSMCVTVFADVDKTFETKDFEDTEAVTNSRNVTVNVKNGGTAATVYKVDITWDSLEFTYSYAENENALEWNPTTHKYTKGDSLGSWDKTTATIKVENHSNASVNVETAFSDGKDTAIKNGVTAKITGVTSNNDFGTSTNTSTTTTTNDPTTGTDGSVITSTTTSTGTSSSYQLRTAEDTDHDAAPTLTNTVTVSGAPSVIDGFDVGTVVVTITK